MSGQTFEQRRMYNKCYAHVLAFFKFNIGKTHLWFSLENPMLGNISPNYMLRVGRHKKLLQFIERQMDENKPPRKK